MGESPQLNKYKANVRKYPMLSATYNFFSVLSEAPLPVFETTSALGEKLFNSNFWMFSLLNADLLDKL